MDIRNFSAYFFHSQSHLRVCIFQPVKDDNGLLPYDAMESVLPEYNYVFVDPHAEGHHPAQRPAYSSR